MHGATQLTAIKAPVRKLWHWQPVGKASALDQLVSLGLPKENILVSDIHGVVYVHPSQSVPPCLP